MRKEDKNKLKGNSRVNAGELTGMRALRLFLLAFLPIFLLAWLAPSLGFNYAIKFLVEIGTISTQSALLMSFILTFGLAIVYFWYFFCTKIGSQRLFKLANVLETFIIQSLLPSKPISSLPTAINLPEQSASFTSHIPFLPDTPPRTILA
jgi:Na+/melibiose symporter-like transporter